MARAVVGHGGCGVEGGGGGGGGVGGVYGDSRMFYCDFRNKGEGGMRKEGKEVAKETNQILQKNKSTMLNDLGCTEVNPDIFKAQES